MKKIIILFLVLALALSLGGCCLKHEWAAATCAAPATCVKCGETEGEALEHTWTPATCTEPKTCITCGLTEGEALPFEYFPMDSYGFIEAYNKSEHALGTLTKESNRMKVRGTSTEVTIFVWDDADPPGSSSGTYIIPDMDFNVMRIRFVHMGTAQADSDAMAIITLISQSFAEILDPTYNVNDFVADATVSNVGNSITLTYMHNGFEYELEGYPGIGDSYFYDFDISLTANKF